MNLRAHHALRTAFASALILATSACSWSLPGMSARTVIPMPAAKPGDEVTQAEMMKVYQAVRTPYKYGVVYRLDKDNPANNDWVDCPGVFKHDGKWYMAYVIFDGRGYESAVAESDDLLHWKPVGKTMPYTDTGWDTVQKAGYIALQDTDWNGSWELEKYKGKYWMSYFGGSREGMETDPLSISMAWSTQPGRAVEWERLPEPALSGVQPDARAYETATLFKSNVIHDPAKTTGWPFVMYYNGRPKNPRDNGRPSGHEQIGMAVSKDMVHWRRFGQEPVVGERGNITGDPQVVRIGDLWVMFYFGAFWRPGAFDTFACSRDLMHWTKWTGPDLIESSTRWDKTFAHKPWLVTDNGVVYHFYCAVGDGGRTIGLATSRPMGE